MATPAVKREQIIFCCPNCDFSSPIKSTITSHVDTHYYSQGAYICDLCPPDAAYRSGSQGLLHNHKSKSHKDYTSAAPLSTSSSSSPTAALPTVQKEASQSKSKSESSSQVSSDSSSSSSSSSSSIETKRLTRTVINEEKEEGLNDYFACPYCKFVTLDSDLLAKHLMNHMTYDKGTSIISIPSSKGFKTQKQKQRQQDQEKKTFTSQTRQDLVKGTKRVNVKSDPDENGMLRCPHCEYQSPTTSSVRYERHCKSHFDSTGPKVCDLCPAKAAYRGRDNFKLDRHKKLCHPSILSTTSPSSSSSPSPSSSEDNNNDDDDDDEKGENVHLPPPSKNESTGLFECNYCDCVGAYLTALLKHTKNHFKTHLLYACDLCSPESAYRSNYLADLNKHKRVHHRNHHVNSNSNSNDTDSSSLSSSTTNKRRSPGMSSGRQNDKVNGGELTERQRWRLRMQELAECREQRGITNILNRILIILTTLIALITASFNLLIF